MMHKRLFLDIEGCMRLIICINDIYGKLITRDLLMVILEFIMYDDIS